MPIHEGSDPHRSAGFTYSLDNSSRESTRAIRCFVGHV